MTTAADLSGSSVAWWKEPTREQWLAWVAAWLGWTLDAFDFTMFLLIMVPISQEFHVPLTDVAVVLSVTLWLRLVGAVGSGWLADRVGRKIPLMISILWYSLSNFLAGFSPTFGFLFLFRALLGIGMGARMAGRRRWRWRRGRSRSRGFMGGVLQGSWGLGFCCRAASMACSMPRSAGAACCGSVCCPRCPSSSYANSSRSRESGWRIGGGSGPRSGRFMRRYSASSRRHVGNTLTACWWMAATSCRLLSIARCSRRICKRI